MKGGRKMSEPKKMSRRGFLKGVAGAAVAGVGGSLLPKGAHSQARSLAIWHTEPADSTVKAVQKVCDRFMELHPGVKVVQEGIGWADLGPKLTISLAAGNPPDISHIQPYMFRSFQKKGFIIPIDDVIRSIGVDNIHEAVRDMTLYRNHWWGISHEVGCPLLMIRKDIAEQAGFKVPDDITKPMFKTWAEQIEYLKAVTKPEKRQWGMSLPGTGYFLQEHCGRWVGGNGGSFYDEKWNPAFHKEPFIGVLEFVKTLSDQKLIPPDWLSQSWLGMIVEFSTGMTTMIDHGYGRIAVSIAKYAPDKASEDYFKPIWRPVGPLGKVDYTDLDSEPWVIFAKSKNQDLAKEWLKLFYSRDMYLNYIKTYPVHMYPITKSLANDPEYQALPELKQWPSWVRQQAEYIKRKQATPVGVFAPAKNIQIPFLAEIFDSGMIVDEIVAMVQGRRKVKEAAQRISDRANDLIKKLGYPVPDPIRSEKKA
jgi:ABC-type glycerol-3-phosphate transport system substrate-binding protein